MSHQYKVTPTEISMVRIYLKPSDKTAKRSRTFWPGKPLYRELVAQAKRDGIMNAIAHHTHYGYSTHGPVRENGSEIADPHLTMCVELIGRRAELEHFCEGHGDLLAGKIIVYKHLERCNIGPTGLSHEDGAPDALELR